MGFIAPECPIIPNFVHDFLIQVEPQVEFKTFLVSKWRLAGSRNLILF